MIEENMRYKHRSLCINGSLSNRANQSDIENTGLQTMTTRCTVLTMAKDLWSFFASFFWPQSTPNFFYLVISAKEAGYCWQFCPRCRPQRSWNISFLDLALENMAMILGIHTIAGPLLVVVPVVRCFPLSRQHLSSCWLQAHSVCRFSFFSWEGQEEMHWSRCH